MSHTHTTPHDAEDAFYDALDDGNLEQLLAVWADSDDVCCLLPMQPLIQGRDGIEALFTRVLSRGTGVSLVVTDLGWIETDEVAIHTVEETIQPLQADAPPQQPIYGINIYRNYPDGWRLIVHQNAPMPPPRPA